MRIPLLLVGLLTCCLPASGQSWSFDDSSQIPSGEDIWLEPGDLIEIDGMEFVEGTASVRIDCAEGYCGLWWELRDIDQFIGQAMTVTVMAKAAYTDDDDPAYLWIVARDGTERLEQGDTWDDGPMGESDWVSLSATMKVPEETEFIGIMLESGGEGTAWFDDMRVVVDEWTFADTARQWSNEWLGMWTRGWFGWLKMLFTFVALPFVLLVFARRSRKKESIAGVPWPTRWLGISLLITVTGMFPQGEVLFGLESVWRPALAWMPFLQRFVYAALFGLIITLVWRRMASDMDEVQLWRNTKLVIRFFLIAVFFTYSWAKFFRTQFAPIPEFQLDGYLGDLTSMRLLWLYFGHSYPYVLFIGASQAVAAVFLAYRRTYVLGALGLVAIVTNIVYVNFAYGIWVKWQSGLYLAMAIFLCLDEVPRLFQVLVQRSSQLRLPIPTRAALPRPWGTILATVLVLVFAASTTRQFQEYVENRDDSVLPIAGMWRVESRQPAASDSLAATRWERLAASSTGLANGSGVYTSLLDQRYERLEEASYNDTTGVLTLMWADSTDTFSGSYELQGDSTLILSGIQYDDSTRIVLSRKRYQLEPDK